MRATGLKHQSAGGGFTLLEVMLAIVIVGTGITAAMQLFVSTTQQNASAVQMTVAMNLANNIQELMAGASYTNPDGLWNWHEKTPVFGDSKTDVDDYDTAVYNPPLDAGGQNLTTLSKYTQRINVSMAKHTDFTPFAGVSKTDDQGVRKVVVTVSYKRDTTSPDNVVYTMSFLRFNDMAIIGAQEH